MNPTDNGTGRERAGVGVAVAVTGRPPPGCHLAVPSVAAIKFHPQNVQLNAQLLWQ